MTTNKIVKIGMLCTIAYLLQILGSFMGLKVGGFLEIEFSDFPALIGALALGPMSGVVIELLKNLLHCLSTSTGFVGELANFVINGTFVLTAGLIYKFNRTRKGAVIAMSVATVVMAVTGVFANLYIMLPLYMPDAAFAVKLQLVLYTIVPFNLARGAVLSAITFVSYKKLKGALKL